MRILFLTPFVPSGERPAALNHLRLLSREHQVSLVCLYRDAAELQDLEALRSWAVDVHALPLRPVDSVVSCAARVATRWPLYVAFYYNRHLVRSIRAIAESRSFDVVHAHTIRMAPFALDLKSLPRVCNLEDILADRFAGYVQHDRISPRLLLDAEELLKLRSFEPWICDQMQASAVISDEEVIALTGLGVRVPPRVIRAGIDAAHFAPYPDSERTKHIVFIGRLSYRPNVESALRVAESIFPRVRLRVPDARFLIIGPTPPTCLQRLNGSNGITVTGKPADIRPYLGRAALSVCPMTTGGGVKFKVLESMAMSTPVVTNTLGAQGAGVTPGANALVAEGDDALADDCIRLLLDAKLRQLIGVAGREHVLQRHDWEVVSGPLEAFHRDVTG